MKLERVYLNTWESTAGSHEPQRGSLKRRIQKAETPVQGAASIDGSVLAIKLNVLGFFTCVMR